MQLRVLFLLFLLPLPAIGDDDADHELTPHLGFRFGGDLEVETVRVGSLDIDAAVGLTYGGRLSNQGWWWAAWSLQRTELDAPTLLPEELDIDVHYLHIGTSYRKGRGFVLFGLGATWVDPRQESFNSGLGASLVVGGGLRTPIKETIDLRFDARAYLTFTELEVNGICGGVGCAIDFTGGGELQVELMVGLAFGF